MQRQATEKMRGPDKKEGYGLSVTRAVSANHSVTIYVSHENKNRRVAAVFVSQAKA